MRKNAYNLICDRVQHYNKSQHLCVLYNKSTTYRTSGDRINLFLMSRRGKLNQSGTIALDPKKSPTGRDLLSWWNVALSIQYFKQKRIKCDSPR